MRILHTADWHLGKRLEHYERSREQREVLAEICTIAENEVVDTVIIAGDVFDVYNPPTESIELFYRTVHRLSRGGQCAVIVIAGNHDSPDRIEAPHPLAGVCGIFLAGYPNSIIPKIKLESGLEVLRSEPGFLELKLPRYTYPLRLLLTPYANELRIKKLLDDNTGNELRQLLQAHWERLASTYCDENGVNVLAAHLFVCRKDKPMPAEPEDEKPVLHIGGAQAIYTENLPAQVQYVALGHLHRFQVISDIPCPVIYSSSILEYSFSEVNQTKYVSIVDLEPGKPAACNRIPIQAGKKLIRKRFDDALNAIQWLRENQDCLVEITLQSDEYIKSSDLKAMHDAHEGIIHIIPDIRISAENREEKHQLVDLSQDMETLFRKFFLDCKKQEPNDEIIDIFKEIAGMDDEGDA